MVTKNVISGHTGKFLKHVCHGNVQEPNCRGHLTRVTRRPCWPLTPRKCPPAKPVYQLWHDVAGSPNLRAELHWESLLSLRGNQVGGGGGSRQVKIASLEYSGLKISVSLLNSRAQGVRWSAQLWTGLVSLSLPAPPAPPPPRRLPAPRPCPFSACHRTLSSTCWQFPGITPECAAPARLAGRLDSGPSRSKRPPLFLPWTPARATSFKSAALDFFPPLAAKEFREGKKKKKKKKKSLFSECSWESLIPALGARECQGPGPAVGLAVSGPADVSGSTGLAPADCPFPSVEFGPTDYRTGRVARCHRALHLAEAFWFTGYFTKLQLHAGPVLAWSSSH